MLFPQKILYEPNSQLGWKPDKMLGHLVNRYVEEGTLKQSWGCVSGCGYKCQGFASLPRALKHATKCHKLAWVDPGLFHDALKESGDCSLGAQVERDAQAEVQAIATLSSHSILWMTHPESGPSKAPTALSKSKKSKEQSSKLPVQVFREAGGRTKEAAWVKLQRQVDHAIMCLICVRGLVPNVIDSPEWTELMNLLNPQYHPTSASSFANNHIPPCEAVDVRRKQIELLKNESNITLTFDGTSILKPESISTAHATTPSCVSYLLDGHGGGHNEGDKSHDMPWIKNSLFIVS
jgi:hypothetical protein